MKATPAVSPRSSRRGKTGTGQSEGLKDQSTGDVEGVVDGPEADVSIADDGIALPLTSSGVRPAAAWTSVSIGVVEAEEEVGARETEGGEDRFFFPLPPPSRRAVSTSVGGARSEHTPGMPRKAGCIW